MRKGVSGILVLRHARSLAEMNKKLICIGVFGVSLVWFDSFFAALIIVGFFAVIALVLLPASSIDLGFDEWGSDESSESGGDREGGGDSADSGGDWGGGCD